MKKQLLTLFALLAIAISAQSKTINVFVEPDNATIFLNGQEVSTGNYAIKFSSKQDFVVLKFEAPGYMTRSVKLFKANPSKSVSYKLNSDEAFMNSLGEGDGIDLANKSFSITCKKGMDEKMVWRRLISIVINHFENLDVRDEAAGWIRSAWTVTSFPYQVVRTRIEVRQQFLGEDELSYKITLQSEIASKEHRITEQSYKKYPRLLKKYESVVNELQTIVGSN